jgi:hypothetical protein
MNETAQGALIGSMVAGFFTLCGVAGTLWFNSKQRRAEAEERARQREEDYREWYTRTLFERRFQAVQQAFAWWRRLHEAVARASGDEDPNSGENQSLREVATQAREWYYNNSFCLEHPSLSEMRPGLSKFLGLTESALTWAGGRRDIEIHKELNEVYKWILKLESRLLEPERREQVGARHDH